MPADLSWLNACRRTPGECEARHTELRNDPLHGAHPDLLRGLHRRRRDGFDLVQKQAVDGPRDGLNVSPGRTAPGLFSGWRQTGDWRSVIARICRSSLSPRRGFSMITAPPLAARARQRASGWVVIRIRGALMPISRSRPASSI